MERAPEFYQGSAAYHNAQFTPEKRVSGDAKNGDHFTIEDLLDFPNDDVMITDGTFEAAITGNSANSSTVTAVDNNSSNSSSFSTEPYFAGDNAIAYRNNFPDANFPSELCVPYDDLAELEWLSNFVEESFSSEDLQKLQLIQGIKAGRNDETTHHQYQFEPENTRSAPMLGPEMSVPAKARSKRSRAAPGNWTSRLLVVSPNPIPTNDATDPATSSSSDSTDISSSSGKKTVKVALKKKEPSDHATTASGGEGRKCLHCATDKTPQWRTGPMGPKTLCNACGVRYKSGRLVPEYRPAASPTFVLTKHSNSHRKVLELRRQKELLRAQQQQQQFLHQNMMFDVSNSDDYLIHQHIGPDFRQLI